MTNLSNTKKVWIGIAIVVVLLVIWVVSSYNGLVTMKESTTSQWQQVETVYQRRFDLIPNLVESVKGVMKQEQTIFTALAEARTRYTGAQTVSDRAEAAGQVETALGRLLAVVENYPTLKSSETVQDLMTQLEGTENRISVERQRYNDVVREYQVAIKRFPRSIIASMFNFTDVNYFEAVNGAENAPQVKL
jgi:LemA protein